MAKFKVQILVRLKKEVLDPQGDSIKTALKTFGIKDVEKIRQGKIFDVNIQADNEENAKENVKEIIEKLLVNELIEEYQTTIEKI